jgi:hypothetical protein
MRRPGEGCVSQPSGLRNATPRSATGSPDLREDLLFGGSVRYHRGLRLGYEGLERRLERTART